MFSCSCATYGIPTRLPLSENHPQRPINPYGHTKLVVEQMLREAEGGARNSLCRAPLFQRGRSRPERGIRRTAWARNTSRFH